jgi:hypothetical protein
MRSMALVCAAAIIDVMQASPGGVQRTAGTRVVSSARVRHGLTPTIPGPRPRSS